MTLPTGVIEALRAGPVFRRLSPGETGALLAQGHGEQYGVEALIEAPSAILVVLGGSARPFLRLAGAREVWLDPFLPGSLIPLLPESGGEHGIGLRADAYGAEVLVLPRPEVLAALRSRPEAGGDLLDAQRSLLGQALHFVAELLSYKVEARLAHRLAERAGRSVDCRFDATHHELAMEIGSSRSPVGEHMSEFRRLGLVDYPRHDAHRHTIHVLDRERLAGWGRPVVYRPHQDIDSSGPEP